MMTKTMMTMYRVSQLSVDRIQFLAVWTGRRVKLDQNIFIWIINDIVKSLSNNHLQERTTEGSETTEITDDGIKVENAQKTSQAVPPGQRQSFSRGWAQT